MALACVIVYRTFELPWLAFMTVTNDQHLQTIVDGHYYVCCMSNNV